MSKFTDFGFTKVNVDDKTNLVNEVFSSVANKYDIMNDLMSGGIHRLWKQRILDIAAPKDNDIVIDLASGTADVALKIAKKVTSGTIWLTDINADMLKLGKAKMLDHGFVGNCSYAVANAESLPFPDSYCDIITMSFGLRNVTYISKVLNEMQRVLKPGGKAIICEFSKPEFKSLEKLYDFYSFNILPKIGKFVANDENSYQYLVESIRKHPDQNTLKEMLSSANFTIADYENLTGGIVAIHIGIK